MQTVTLIPLFYFCRSVEEWPVLLQLMLAVIQPEAVISSG